MQTGDLSIDESSGYGAVGIDAPVTEEWPPSPHLLASVEVDVDDEVCGSVRWGLCKDFTLRSADEARPPERHAVLCSDAIDGYER